MHKPNIIFAYSKKWTKDAHTMNKSIVRRIEGIAQDHAFGDFKWINPKEVVRKTDAGQTGNLSFFSCMFLSACLTRVDRYSVTGQQHDDSLR